MQKDCIAFAGRAIHLLGVVLHWKLTLYGPRKAYNAFIFNLRNTSVL